jgi:hypothetical protein
MLKERPAPDNALDPVAEFPTMSRCSLVILLLLPLLLVAADPPPADKLPLQAGKDLPGSFRPYNVSGPHAGKFHCQVTEHGVEPGVLVFVRDFTTPDALATVRPLLTALDERIEKYYTRSRLNATAVFLSDDLADATGTAGDPPVNAANDDLREKLEKPLQDFANSEPKLKHVVVTLDDKDDVKKYGLDDSKFVTVVLFKQLKVVAVYALKKEDLTAKKVTEILDAVGDKLGATRK